MKKFFSVLRRCPLFDQVEDGDLLPLLSCLGATVRSFEKKQTILADGDPADCMGVVLSGRAQVVRIDYCGNRSILSDVEPSQLFAESFACAGMDTLPVAIVADEPCQVLLIHCARVICACSNACAFHQQLIYNLMRCLADKNIMFHQKLEVASKRSTREKLLTYLNLQARRSRSSSFDIPFDRQELADFLEVDRSGLSAEISKLRREGVLLSDRSHFQLL